MDDIIATAPAPPLPPPVPPMVYAAPARVEYPFEFSGDSGEYFRIWVVNLALSILTLGVFSAWAKVRTERYFYGNTRLAGDAFEYVAKPWPILKGRIIALVLFGSYVLGGQFSLKLQLGAALVIALLAPWLVVRGAAFRARYSMWRGLNFRFVPDYREAYVRYLLLMMPAVLTLGLMYPFVKAKQKAFFVEHHRYGGSSFDFRATTGQFYPPYLLAWLGIIIVVLVASVLMGVFVVSMGPTPGKAPPTWILVAYMIPLYTGYFFVWVFLTASISNLVYNHTSLGPHEFRSTLKTLPLFGIYAVNALAIVASAGFLIPWAKIRLARYRAENLRLVATGDLFGFVAERHADIGAAAAEMDGLFDIDIGL